MLIVNIVVQFNGARLPLIKVTLVKSVVIIPFNKPTNLINHLETF